MDGGSTSTEPGSGVPWKSAGSLAVGLLVTGSLLWWVLRDVALTEVLGRIVEADRGLLAAAVVLVASTYMLRATRWRAMLRQADGRPGLLSLFRAYAVGIMANDLLPARSGELIRAYSLSSQTDVRMSTAFSSIALERVFDLVAVLVLTAGAVYLLGDLDHVADRDLFWIAGLAGATSLLVLAAATLMALRPRICRRFLTRLLGAVPLVTSRVRDRASETIGGLLEGLQTLRTGRQTAVVAFWSLANWLMNAGAFWLGLQAFDIHAPLSAPFILQAAVVLAIAIPSSPGFFGAFEAAGRIALSLYAVDAGRAVPFIITMHVAVFFLPSIAIGIVSIPGSGMDFGSITKSLRKLAAIGGAKSELTSSPEQE